MNLSHSVKTREFVVQKPREQHYPVSSRMLFPHRHSFVNQALAEHSLNHAPHSKLFRSTLATFLCAICMGAQTAESPRLTDSLTRPRNAFQTSARAEWSPNSLRM